MRLEKAILVVFIYPYEGNLREIIIKYVFYLLNSILQ